MAEVKANRHSGLLMETCRLQYLTDPVQEILPPRTCQRPCLAVVICLAENPTEAAECFGLQNRIVDLAVALPLPGKAEIAQRASLADEVSEVTVDRRGLMLMQVRGRRGLLDSRFCGHQ